MLPFKHRNLNLRKKEIRLLQLHKTEDEAAPIRLNIRHDVLDEQLDFKALSYAWGDDPPSQHVIVCDEDGQEGLFAIRENLYDFLVAAQKFHEPWTTEWIWIDQICINQSHHEERCHQVAQMATLYSTARATIVWPGVMPSPHEEPSELTSVIDFSTYEEAVHQFENLDFDKTLLDSLMRNWLPSLLIQPYWSRLWIVQEIALASSVFVFLTHATYSLDLFECTLRLVPQFLQEDATARRKIGLIIDKIFGFWRIQSLISTSRHISWYDVLLSNRETHVSEPLDRVYAMMGLVSEGMRFQPDYNLSREELLKKVFEVEIARAQLHAHRMPPFDVLKIIVERVMGDLLQNNGYVRLGDEREVTERVLVQIDENLSNRYGFLRPTYT